MRNCSDECINRLTFYECDYGTCPCGLSCTNTKIQNHEMLPLEVFQTTGKGLGIKTSQSIKSGSFIIEYVGEVITEQLLKSRMETRYRNDNHYYSMYLEDNLVIDARNMGNLSRFINHSCRPNAVVQKWTINGLPSLALFSLRDIAPEEEITFDYKYSPYNIHETIPCNCKETVCRQNLTVVCFK